MILAKGDRKSVVYTAASQVVYLHDQDEEEMLERAKDNLRAEMRRNFANAKKADTYADYKDEESNPPTSCDD